MREKKISAKTYDRVVLAKSYIEKKYKSKKLLEDEMKKGIFLIIYQEWTVINKVLNDLKISEKEAETIKKEIHQKESENLRIQRQKMSIREFESIAIIGKGAFGEVRVCRKLDTGEIVAVKKLRKIEMIEKNQVLHITTEKEVLSIASNPWIVELKYSFQVISLIK